MMKRILCALIAAVVPVASASAADIAVAIEPEVVERRCSLFNNIWIWGDPTDCPDDETVPLCEAPTTVKAALASAARAENVYRVPDVVEFNDPRELEDIYFNPSPLVRRYCAAHVLLTNGDRTTMYYFVEEDAGFVGLGWKVYTCILGYDRWRVYDGRCRVARPPHQFIKSENILD